MSRVGEWLAGRRPPAPPELAEALARVRVDGGPTAEALARAARERLDAARARPGRVRESAFRLLEADALLTYACEAALESEDPDAELGRVLAVASG
ncbi:MAG TPA: hypothetical protein VFQ22_12810 [Longimicrobiales bacterium]|nr:hypothetical protein [Longimicrobiales bacterium]